MGPAEADIDFDIIRNDNDTFTVKYTPPGAGSYTIMVLFADQVTHAFSMCASVCAYLLSCPCVYTYLSSQAIPLTPIRIKVDPSHDASKVKAEGPGLSRTGEKINDTSLC